MTCRKINKKIILLFFFMTCRMSLSAMNIVNTLQPYDTLIRPYYDGKRSYQVAVYAETGFDDAQGFDPDGDKVNVLQIWQKEQNALAMLEGFDPNSAIGQLRNRLDATDDGVRGHFDVCGKLELDLGFALVSRFFFAQDWSVGVYFPFYKMELKDVVFTDKTKNITEADRRVKELLTDNLAENVKNLGQGLDIGGWKRGGPGDLTVLLEWFRDFPQNKEFLKNARVNWRAGVSFPTSRREDEDKIFAIPFGNDGAFSIPFGLGLDLTLGSHVKLGVDVQLTHIFNTTVTRRIKTSENQTELLLLQKAQIHKDFGLVQRFNLYTQLYHIFKGLSFKIGYQFLKHGDDEIALKTNNFSSEIANTAQRLQEFTMHHAITKTTYDFGVHMPDSRYRPEISLFIRHPFNGKRVALVPMVGVIVSVDF